MKEYKKEVNRIVRIKIGSRSLTFRDTTIDRVFDVAIKVFENVTYQTPVQCVLESPLKTKTTIYIREEGTAFKDNSYKGESRSKTLYGIKSLDAFALFRDTYEKYIND